MSIPTPPPASSRIKVFSALGVIGLAAAVILLYHVLPDHWTGVRPIRRRAAFNYLGLIAMSIYFLWRAYKLRRDTYV